MTCGVRQGPDAGRKMIPNLLEHRRWVGRQPVERRDRDRQAGRPDHFGVIRGNRLPIRYPSGRGVLGSGGCLQHISADPRRGLGGGAGQVPGRRRGFGQGVIQRTATTQDRIGHHDGMKF